MVRTLFAYSMLVIASPNPKYISAFHGQSDSHRDATTFHTVVANFFDFTQFTSEFKVPIEFKSLGNKSLCFVLHFKNHEINEIFSTNKKNRHSGVRTMIYPVYLQPIPCEKKKADENNWKVKKTEKMGTKNRRIFSNKLAHPIDLQTLNWHCNLQKML